MVEFLIAATVGGGILIVLVHQLRVRRQRQLASGNTAAMLLLDIWDEVVANASRRDDADLTRTEHLLDGLLMRFAGSEAATMALSTALAPFAGGQLKGIARRHLSTGASAAVLVKYLSVPRRRAFQHGNYSIPRGDLPAFALEALVSRYPKSEEVAAAFNIDREAATAILLGSASDPSVLLHHISARTSDDFTAHAVRTLFERFSDSAETQAVVQLSQQVDGPAMVRLIVAARDVDANLSTVLRIANDALSSLPVRAEAVRILIAHKRVDALLSLYRHPVDESLRDDLFELYRSTGRPEAESQLLLYLGRRENRNAALIEALAACGGHETLMRLSALEQGLDEEERDALDGRIGVAKELIRGRLGLKPGGGGLSVVPQAEAGRLSTAESLEGAISRTDDVED